MARAASRSISDAETASESEPDEDCAASDGSEDPTGACVVVSWVVCSVTSSAVVVSCAADAVSVSAGETVYRVVCVPDGREEPEDGSGLPQPDSIIISKATETIR